MNKIDILIIIYFSILLVITISLVIRPKVPNVSIQKIVKRKKYNKKDKFIEQNFKPLALGKLIIYPDFVYKVPAKFTINNTTYFNYQNVSFINEDGLLVSVLDEKGKVTDWKRLSKETFFVAVESYKNTRESFDKEIIPIHTLEVSGKRYNYQYNKDNTILIRNVFDENDLRIIRKYIDIINYEIQPIKAGMEAIDGVLVNKYKGLKLKALNSNKNKPFIDTTDSEYYFKGKKTTREDAIAIVEMSEKPDDLKNLSYKKDSSLSDFIFKKYPNLDSKSN